MKQLTVVLKRHHFPDKLNDDSIANAFWVSPCIMDKALHEQYPSLAPYHFDIYGELRKKWNSIWVLPEALGKIEGSFTYAHACEVAEELRHDPSYEKQFTLILNDYL